MEHTELIGKKLTRILPAMYGCAFFLWGKDIGVIRVHRGYYIWRLCHNGEILISSANFYALLSDDEDCGFWPMDGEGRNIYYYDQYMRIMSQNLKRHLEAKLQVANDLMNGVTVAACQSDDMHNLVVNFSNGAILEVFALMDEKDGDASRYKMICLYDKITEEERVLLL